MKTLVDVKLEYEELFEKAKQLSPKTDGKRAITVAKKRLQFLNKIILYLDTIPNAEYITGALRGLEEKKRRLYDQCPCWPYKNPEQKKVAEAWLKEREMEKIKTQIKFLNYIMN